MRVKSLRSKSIIAKRKHLTRAKHSRYTVVHAQLYSVQSIIIGTQNTVLEISGLTSGIDKEHLQLYFESSESNGEDGAVKDCILVPPGSAFVTFFSSDGMNV